MLHPDNESIVRIIVSDPLQTRERAVFRRAFFTMDVVQKRNESTASTSFGKCNGYAQIWLTAAAVGSSHRYVGSWPYPACQHR